MDLPNEAFLPINKEGEGGGKGSAGTLCRGGMDLQTSEVESYDYVIVGGGSAGSIIAARLSEKESATVCLLEAGPKDRHPFVHLPAGFIKVIFDKRFVWGYETEPGPAINDRRLPVIQGHVLGGSGSINGMVYTRGQAEDFDAWAARGNAGWSYRDVLPYFRKLETFAGPGDDQYRGRLGGLPTIELNWQNQLVDAFLASCRKQGIPDNPDYNGKVQVGAGRYQYTIKNGKRVSAAKAFLRPAAGRKNLNVVTDALVSAVIVENQRAVGVRVQRTGDPTVREIRARKEVVLSAGAINTPKLLQLSGIGPGKLLKDLGIEVVREMPGVGENLHDHYTPRLTYRAKDNVESINMLARGPKLLGQFARWVAGQPSILGIGVVLGAAYWKSRPELDRPDIVVTFTPGTFKLGFLGVLDDFPGLTIGVWPLRPESRGYVRIASSDPRAKPLIQPNYFADARDQQVTVEAMRIARRIMDTPDLASLCVEETMPGRKQQSDEDFLAYARAQGLGGYHFCSTARMGKADDRGAVVDEQLRVHGIQGLRIVDASIMPSVVSGNTNAATMMIAEKAAAMMAA